MSAAEHEEGFAIRREVRSFYRRRGRGPLLVMVHGAEADHGMFDALVERLAPHFTVVAYDQRDSGRTINGDAAYGLEALADDAAALIAAVGGSPIARAHVYGTSFGGQIAQVLALRHPDRVEGLVLGSTWRVGRGIGDFNAPVFAELMRLRADPVRNAAAIAPYFLDEGYLAAHPEALDIFRGASRNEAQKQRRAAMMQAPPPAMDWRALRAPVLLMAGSADRLIPHEATFELGEHIGGAEHVLLDGVPHIGALAAPERLALAVRDFLQRPAR